MSTHSADTLAILFAMEPGQIKADLARGDQDYGQITEELRQSFASKVRTPAALAAKHHLGMVQAHALAQQDDFRAEVRLFMVLLAAEPIAEEAVNVADQQPAGAALLQQIDAIYERAGLAADEGWRPGEEPADLAAVSLELEAQQERVRSMVLAYVLRRYGLAEYADLLEQDRTSFAVAREIGRRLMALGERSESERATDQSFREKWGDEARERVHARIEAVRQIVEGDMP